MDPAELFLRETTIRLRQEYLPRLESALEGLSTEDVWWRPHEDTTSIGILLRHLEGNVRQWILCGLAGAPDHRLRAEEFEAEERPSTEALVDALRSTVQLTCRFLDAVEPERLREEVHIQGFRSTWLGAIYHVLEHFGWHTGQITWIAKLRKGPAHGIAFYDDDSLNEPQGG